MALVALGEATETTNPRTLSAAAQDILRDVAEELREELREDLATLREGGSYEHTFAVQQHLPAGFARYYTPELVAQWAGSAEELAGHALIERCEELIDEHADELDDPDGLREKFSEVHDLAFEDHDILMLFDARFDGIEDHTTGIGAALGVANLHPGDWFKPFRSDQ